MAPNGLDISIDFSGRDPVIVLSGYVDHSTTGKLREALTELIDANHERLTIDVEGVTFMVTHRRSTISQRCASSC